MNKAVVIGDNHHNTLGLIRSLGECQVPVYAVLFGNGGSFVAKSKYLKMTYDCRPGADDLEKLLMEQFGRENEKPVLIPSCDTAALLLDRIYDRLCDSFFVGSIDRRQGRISDLMNKYRMNESAASAGLRVPKFMPFVWDGATDTITIEEMMQRNDLQYPLIVKPLASVLGNKSMIHCLNNREELTCLLRKMQLGRYLFQNYIKKTDELGVQGVALYPGNVVYIPGVIWKARQSEIAAGSTTYAVLDRDACSDEIEKVSRFVSQIGYRGIFDIELMKDGDDMYFIELNFRNGAYGYAYTRAGANLAYIWYLSCIGELDAMPREPIRKVFLMNEFADFAHVKNRHVPFFKWLLQYLKTNVKLVGNLHDMKPFFYKLIYH
ncbi:MAG: hypothetical protein ABFC94_02690 [Syntrophomonas sp.]